MMGRSDEDAEPSCTVALESNGTVRRCGERAKGSVSGCNRITIRIDDAMMK